MQKIFCNMPVPSPALSTPTQFPDDGIATILCRSPWGVVPKMQANPLFTLEFLFVLACATFLGRRCDSLVERFPYFLWCFLRGVCTQSALYSDVVVMRMPVHNIASFSFRQPDPLTVRHLQGAHRDLAVKLCFGPFQKPLPL